MCAANATQSHLVSTIVANGSRRSILTALTLAGVFLVGCDSAFDPPNPLVACERHAARYNAKAVAAFASTVGRARDLAGTVEAFPDYSRDYPAIVCYYDGLFGLFGRGGEPRDRALAGIVDDVSVVLRTGSRRTLPVTPP